MTVDRPEIILEGKFGNWPGEARTLTPCRPEREPNRPHVYSFGAELDQGNDEVWFRITWEAIRRMKERTPHARGNRLVDALVSWMTPERSLEPGLNRFKVRVSETGDTWIERQ